LEETIAISQKPPVFWAIAPVNAILSLISFSRIFGGGVIEEDEWRRYG